MSLHHPLVQSLALPFALAFVWAALARTLAGPESGARWAAAGVSLGLVLSSIAAIGWVGRPLSITEKLPWIIAAAALAGIVAEWLRASARLQWAAAGALWALAVIVVLGNQPMLPRIGSWIVGMAVIGAVLAEPPARANAAAMLVVAALGLAALAMRSGSALLFELSLALSAAVAAAGLWLWPVSRIRLGASALIAAVVTWLSLAQSTGLLTGAPPGSVLLLAASFSSGAVVRGVRQRLRRGEAPPWVETLLVAGVAVLWVLAALALAHWGGKAFGADPSDPYYAPTWK
ncbi:hypothetical protein QTH91_02080 [Variovorax dokdonensis]|uniref:Uncharacterized protein n=1 Tax=Variovorax dokdonensis TaxID=344883 RepID=A0ABT7N5P3_9BURK|nr:hypothetical protein [Variovorax dokdonensis]MDM0043261.1 hypothetical protein [Variovorax dokdonensis]